MKNWVYLQSDSSKQCKYFNKLCLLLFENVSIKNNFLGVDNRNFKFLELKKYMYIYWVITRLKILSLINVEAAAAYYLLDRYSVVELYSRTS